MLLMEWSEELSVNVKEIDDQHKKLVGMLNELHAAMQAGHGKDVLGGVIGGLADYTAYHFSTEEKYFDEFGYPEAAAHKAQHREFIQKISEFQAGFAKGAVLLSITVMNFLCDWIREHIKESDKKYGPFFNSHGLARSQPSTAKPSLGH